MRVVEFIGVLVIGISIGIVLCNAHLAIHADYKDAHIEVEVNE